MRQGISQHGMAGSGVQDVGPAFRDPQTIILGADVKEKTVPGVRRIRQRQEVRGRQIDEKQPDPLVVELPEGLRRVRIALQHHGDQLELLAREPARSVVVADPLPRSLEAVVIEDRFEAGQGKVFLLLLAQERNGDLELGSVQRRAQHQGHQRRHPDDHLLPMPSHRTPVVYLHTRGITIT